MSMPTSESYAVPDGELACSVGRNDVTDTGASLDPGHPWLSLCRRALEWNHMDPWAVAEAEDMINSHPRKPAGVALNKAVACCRLFDCGSLEPAADAKGTA